MSDNPRLPLENLAQERAVLGVMISDIHAYWTIRDHLKPEYFVEPIHGAIVKALHTLADAGRAFSIASVVSRLPVLPAESEIGDLDAYLATVVALETPASEAADNLGDLHAMWARRRIMAAGQMAIRLAREDDGKSESEKLTILSNALDSVADPLSNSVRHIAEEAMRVAERTADAYERDERIGLSLGLGAIQRCFGDLLPSTLYLLPGAAGSGKTALAEQIARWVGGGQDHTRRGGRDERNPAGAAPVLFVSLEMPGDHIARRQLSRDTGISPRNITQANLRESQVEDLLHAARDLRGIDLHIETPRGPMSVSEIRAKAMRMKRKHGLKLLAIDHLLYLKKPDPRMTDVDAVRPNLRMLKALAKDLEIAILLLTQLKAEFNNGPWSLRRPNLGDCFGGSAIDAEVDAITIMHRPEYQLERKEPADTKSKDWMDWKTAFDECRGKVEFLPMKTRDDRMPGRQIAFFEGKTTTFHDNPPDSMRQNLDYSESLRAVEAQSKKNNGRKLLEQAESFV